MLIDAKISNVLSFSMMVSLKTHIEKKFRCSVRYYSNPLCYSKEVPSPISNISQEEMQKLRKLVRIYCPFNFNHATKVKIKVFCRKYVQGALMGIGYL